MGLPFWFFLWPYGWFFEADEVDDEWRRWLFGAVMLIVLIALFVGFAYAASLILPKHGKP